MVEKWPDMSASTTDTNGITHTEMREKTRKLKEERTES